MQNFRKLSAKLPAGRLLALATLAALGLPAAPVHAGDTTLNFDNFTPRTNRQGFVIVGRSYSAQGFTLTSGTQFAAVAGRSRILGDGETSLYSNNAAPTTLTQDNGQAFNFTAIDLGPLRGNSLGTQLDGPVTFTGTQVGGGTVTVTDTMTSAMFQTFNFTGFTDLQSLTFVASSSNSAPQFDNVVLTPAPASVPEPSTAAVLGLPLLALGGLIVAGRKRAGRPA